MMVGADEWPTGALERPAWGCQSDTVSPTSSTGTRWQSCSLAHSLTAAGSESVSSQAERTTHFRNLLKQTETMRNFARVFNCPESQRATPTTLEADEGASDPRAVRPCGGMPRLTVTCPARSGYLLMQSDTVWYCTLCYLTC
jgi:hypothetical protein